MFDDCVEIFRGYGAVDDVLAQCERIGGQLNAVIASWSQNTRKGKEKASGDIIDESGALSLVTPANERTIKDFLSEQPKSLSKNVQLKGYQLLGVNWLRLLYKKGRSCILADEMGTITTLVISTFAYIDHRFGKDRPGHQFFRTPSGEREKGASSYCRPVSPEAIRSHWHLFIDHLPSMQILNIGELGSGICALRAVHRCPDLLRWQG